MLEDSNNQLLLQEKKLTLKLQKMEKSCANEDSRELVLKREFAEERKSLQQSLDLATSLVEKKNAEMNLFQLEMNKVKAELVMTSSLRDSYVQLESKKVELEIKTQRLQQELDSIKNQQQQPTLTSSPPTVNADFLNSVIAKQQATIKELQQNITNLEKKLLDVDEDLPVDELLGYDDSAQRRMAPRLFCDICDIFDAHETEDCPTQCSDPVEDLGQGSNAKYRRGEVRPYCDGCEVFGHWTENCTEEEMY